MQALRSPLLRRASSVRVACRQMSASAAAATTNAINAANRVAEIAQKPQHATDVAEAARMHTLLQRYRSMPVETIAEDAGSLSEAGQDIGAYVRSRVAAERLRASPPWFFPTHLLPEPQNIPKGARLEFSYKYKYEFVKSGQEPPVNRVVRLRVNVAELGLTSASQRTVFERLMGPRLVNGVVLIAARSRPTRRENEVLALYQLDSSLAATKEIAARLDSTDPSKLTEAQIQEIEEALPEAPVKSRDPEVDDESDMTARMKRVEEKVEVFGDQVTEIYDADVFDQAMSAEKVSNAMQAQKVSRLNARTAAAAERAKNGQAVDEDDEDAAEELEMEQAMSNMTGEQVAATFAEMEATIRRLETADSLSADDEKLASEMKIVTKKEAAVRAKAAAEAQAAAEAKAAEEENKKGGKKKTAAAPAKKPEAAKSTEKAGKKAL